MPFQPGKSGNPNGRPKKGRAVSDILAEIGAERVNGVTRLRRLLDRLHRDAEEGDNVAAKIVIPYHQPEPKEQPEQVAADSGPIKLIDFDEAADAEANQ